MESGNGSAADAPQSFLSACSDEYLESSLGRRNYRILDGIMITVFLSGGTLVLIYTVIVLVCFYKYKYLHTKSNTFIMNLLAVSAINGISAIGTGLSKLIEEGESSGSLCKTNIILAVLYISSSAVALCLIALQRAVKIIFPSLYEIVYTQATIVAMMGGTWSLLVIFVTVATFHLNPWTPTTRCDQENVLPFEYRCMFVILVLSCLLISVLAYISVIVKTHKHNRHMINTIVSGQIAIRKNGIRLIQMSVIVLGSFALTVVPYCLMRILQPQHASELVYCVSMEIVKIPVVYGSLVNLSVYCFYKQDLKVALFRIVFCKNKNRRLCVA